jgi:hypothetical protein
MMLPPVYQILTQAPAVYSLVSDRIYRHGSIPHDSAISPYVTWQLVTGTPENTLSETPSMDRNTLQIDCWSLGDAQVETLAQAVRDAIEPVAHMTGVILDARETDTRLFRISLQFDWFLSRP